MLCSWTRQFLLAAVILIFCLLKLIVPDNEPLGHPIHPAAAAEHDLYQSESILSVAYHRNTARLLGVSCQQACVITQQQQYFVTLLHGAPPDTKILIN